MSTAWPGFRLKTPKVRLFTIAEAMFKSEQFHFGLLAYPALCNKSLVDLGISKEFQT
jgi:hypothetical protein